MSTSKRTQVSIAAAVAGLLVVALLLRYVPQSKTDAQAIGPAEVAADAKMPALVEDAPVLGAAEVPARAEVETEQRQEPVPVVLRNAPRVPPHSARTPPSAPRPLPKYVLLAQLVDETGRPFTAPVTLTIECTTDALSRWFGIGVESDGALRWELQDSPPFEQYHIQLSSEQAVAKPLAYSLQEGTNDLGRITMVLKPVVVAGRVEESNGTPTVGASVVIYHDFNMDTEADWGGFGTVEAFPTATTDETGQFTIRSTEKGKRLLVQVADARNRRTAVSTHFGDAECLIVMPASMQRVEFELKLPPASPRTPYVTAVLLKDPSATRNVFRSIVHPGEKVVFSAVEPGEYSLRLTGGWLFGDVELEAKVEVRSTGGNAPSVLGPYDISAQLGEVRLTVTDPEARGIASRSGSRNLKAGTTLHFWIPLEGVETVVTMDSSNWEIVDGKLVGVNVREVFLTPGAITL
ncbi:MAG: hypothetical protein GC161_07440 [Planctomycetaceae bacterium]|nr:hypothetical protein [Planctomycetaceae bacterium]